MSSLSLEVRFAARFQNSPKCTSSRADWTCSYRQKTYRHLV